MITITNPKVAGFMPRWATFRGFSILFDNPGQSLTSTGERLDLDCQVETNVELQFYRRLREYLDVNTLTNTYLFCPLPPPSYHVTVWDGGNDGNVSKVVRAQRHKLEDFLDGLPQTALAPSELTALPAASTLVTRRDWNITFRFDRLVNWSNSVLVAHLAPADEISAENLNTLALERGRLSADYWDIYRISPYNEFDPHFQKYSPHVSLGYFANRESAQLATPYVNEWNGKMELFMRGAQLTFRQASIYGFTDMATFFKSANNA